MLRAGIGFESEKKKKISGFHWTSKRLTLSSLIGKQRGGHMEVWRTADRQKELLVVEKDN